MLFDKLTQVIDMARELKIIATETQQDKRKRINADVLKIKLEIPQLFDKRGNLNVKEILRGNTFSC